MLHYVYKLEANWVCLLFGVGQGGILEFCHRKTMLTGAARVGQKSKSEATTTSWKSLKSSTDTLTLHIII